MTDKVIENNQVTVMGEIISDFSFSHEIFGEGFYMVDISVKRLSESYDIIPVMVSERLLDVNADYKGMNICISGQFRSYFISVHRGQINIRLTPETVCTEIFISSFFVFL